MDYFCTGVSKLSKVYDSDHRAFYYWMISAGSEESDTFSSGLDAHLKQIRLD